MDVVLQISLLTVTVCLGAAALLRRRTRRAEDEIRIDVAPVSGNWLADHRVRNRGE